MPWIDELPTDITDALPDEIRNNETLNRYNSIADLAKSHLEQRAAISQSIRIPPPEAGDEARQQFLDKLINNAPEVMLKPDFTEPEQRAEFFRTLGMPDAADKYEMPEDAKLPAEVENELRNVFHEANLTNEQFKKIAKRFADMESKRIENLKTQSDEAMEGLKGKWGMTLEDRMEKAKRMNDEFYPGRDFSNLGAADIEALYAIHTSVHGKTPAQAANQPKDQSDILPPAEALRRAGEIINNPKLYDRTTPVEEKRALMQKHKELMMMAGYSDNIDELRAGSA